MYIFTTLVHPPELDTPAALPTPHLTTMPNLTRQFPSMSPPDSPSACRDLGPTPSKSDSDPELVPFLMSKKDGWIKSPGSFFAAMPVNVEKYSDKQSALFGRIALRLRARELYLCRQTWGQRGKTAFLERLKDFEPEPGLAQVNYSKWMKIGQTADIISQSCIAGTIVASSLTLSPDSTYRMVPRDNGNTKHIEFLHELNEPKVHSLANQYAGLEKAMTTHISDAYSCLRKLTKKAPEYGQLQDFSVIPARLSGPQQALGVGSRCDPLPADPDQDLVVTSISQNPTLNSMGQNDVGEQQPFAEHWQNGAQQYEGVAGQPSQHPSQQAQLMASPCINPLDSESITPGFGAPDVPMLVFAGTATIESAVVSLEISTTETDGIASVKRTLRC
ncbi:hypothetical protein LX36DRAFT_658553 [Colletotrichum falcatum]|nr:hypothetical protein LX36DRAFT_658553 [Colletotrichum falcatum]